MCELLGPPAAGKSRVAHELRALGHVVVHEQFQQHLRRLGPRPTTPEEQLRRQEIVVDLVLEAVCATRAPAVVVDVGVIAALTFGWLRLPPVLGARLLDHSTRACDEAEVRIASMCYLHAPLDVLRARAAADIRERRHFDDNIRLDSEVRCVVAGLKVRDPSGLRDMATDDVFDVTDLSRWITSRRSAESDYLGVFREHAGVGCSPSVAAGSRRQGLGDGMRHDE